MPENVWSLLQWLLRSARTVLQRLTRSRIDVRLLPQQKPLQPELREKRLPEDMSGLLMKLTRRFRCDTMRLVLVVMLTMASITCSRLNRCYPSHGTLQCKLKDPRSFTSNDVKRNFNNDTNSLWITFTNDAAVNRFNVNSLPSGIANMTLYADNDGIKKLSVNERSDGVRKLTIILPELLRISHINNLPNLVNLYLFRCKKLTQLPEGLDQLKKLERFSAHLTRITNLPCPTLFALKSLKYLMIINSALTSFKASCLPRSVVELVLMDDRSLEQVDLTSLNQMPDLKKLFVVGGQKLACSCAFLKSYVKFLESRTSMYQHCIKCPSGLLATYPWPRDAVVDVQVLREHDRKHQNCLKTENMKETTQHQLIIENSTKQTTNALTTKSTAEPRTFELTTACTTEQRTSVCEHKDGTITCEIKRQTEVVFPNDPDYLNATKLVIKGDVFRMRFGGGVYEKIVEVQLEFCYETRPVGFQPPTSFLTIGTFPKLESVEVLRCKEQQLNRHNSSWLFAQVPGGLRFNFSVVGASKCPSCEKPEVGATTLASVTEVALPLLASLNVVMAVAIAWKM